MENERRIINPNKLEKLLDRIKGKLKDIFYYVQLREVNITVKRTEEGYDHKVKYGGSGFPLDQVEISKIQEALEYAMDCDPTKSEAEVQGKIHIAELDLLGIKRRINS
ncbi:MAG: hypothetical protein FVQ80_17130 [Planctomycetes bacterium]|nr:hypothetical protein [Planctomycetota bacterium]